ncbi:MAG: hypothetical protein ACRD2R_02810 [Terriglobales bacterium]
MKASVSIVVLLTTAALGWAQQPASAPAAKAPPAAQKAAPSAPSSAGVRRDPFVSPVTARGGPGGPVCPSGKRCLIADQVELKGVAKTSSGMIAMVVNQDKKTYFLRENEPVLNGYVLRITGDSIVFRENVMDNLGRTSTKDVVKRVSAPVV